MKKFIIVFAFLIVGQITYSQGLIADIMDVASVEAAEGSNTKEMIEEYNSRHEELTAKLEESILKLDEEYKKTVTKQVEEFSKVLAKGEKQPTKNAKNRTYTKINSATISLRSKKKSFLAKWKSKSYIATQQLPKDDRNEKQSELKDKYQEYGAIFDEEYDANISSIKAFRDKEHLVEAAPQEMESKDGDM
jgi:hypothetical protein